MIAYSNQENETLSEQAWRSASALGALSELVNLAANQNHNAHANCLSYHSELLQGVADLLCIHSNYASKLAEGLDEFDRGVDAEKQAFKEEIQSLQAELCALKAQEKS